jgi:hypothetical protein
VPLSVGVAVCPGTGGTRKIIKNANDTAKKKMSVVVLEASV